MTMTVRFGLQKCGLHSFSGPLCQNAHVRGQHQKIQEQRPPPLPNVPAGACHVGAGIISCPIKLPDSDISLPLQPLFSHSVHLDQTGFYIGGKKKKAPCLLFSQVPRWGTRAAQCSHLRLPSWTVALKQETFQRRRIPTVDVRTGRLRLFQRQREN